MGKLISGLFGVFFAIAGPLALILAGNWWAMDRPAWHVGPCPLCVGWNAGANARITGLTQAFKTEQASFNAEKAALDRQSAAVASLTSTAQAWQRKSLQATTDAARANAWRLQTADAIQRETLPPDTTAAERCNAAEALLRSAAR